MKISEEVLCLNDELIALRRDFHQHPEIGGKEFRTSQIVEKYLQDLGLETQRMADTGIVATLMVIAPMAKQFCCVQIWMHFSLKKKMKFLTNL